MMEEKNIAEQNSKLWDIVEKELEKQQASAHKIAVIETEKIFQKTLSEKNLPGKDTEEIIKNWERFFKNPDKIKYARAMYKRIITEFNFDISEDDTREIIKGYYKAIADLNNIDFESLSAKEKTKLFLERHFYGTQGRFKKLARGIIILSITVFILTETKSGQNIGNFFLGINNYIYYKIIPTILIILALGLVILGALYAWQKRNK